MNRIGSAILLAGLLALAGCGALSDPSPTRSAFDVNGTTPLHGFEFEPETDRMPDGEDVYDAHLNSLDEASYTVQYESVTRLNGSVASHDRWTLQYANDHSRYHHVTQVGGMTRNGTYQTYANGTHVWRKTTRENETTVELVTDSAGDAMSPSSMGAQVPKSFLQSILYQLEDPAVSELTPASTASSRYRITTDDLAGVDGENASLSVELIVTEDGRVTRLEYHVERTGPEGGQLARTVTLQYLQVNATTVDRPDWVPTTVETAKEDPATTVTTTRNETTMGNATATGNATVSTDRVGTSVPTSVATPLYVVHTDRQPVAAAPRR